MNIQESPEPQKIVTYYNEGVVYNNMTKKYNCTICIQTQPGLDTLSEAILHVESCHNYGKEDSRQDKTNC